MKRRKKKKGWGGHDGDLLSSSFLHLAFSSRGNRCGLACHSPPFFSQSRLLEKSAAAAFPQQLLPNSYAPPL